MIYWFFGFPGIGKDYIARRFSEVEGAHYIHADDLLTAEEKQLLVEGRFTRQDRLAKLARICAYLTQQLAAHADIAIADSLPDQKSRDFVTTYFGNRAVLIHVIASPETHALRIQRREDHFFKAGYLDQWIKAHWEPVATPRFTLSNDLPPDELDAQLHQIRLIAMKT